MVSHAPEFLLSDDMVALKSPKTMVLNLGISCIESLSTHLWYNESEFQIISADIF